MKKIVYLLTLALGLTINLHAQAADVLAKTPQMGWNSWNKFGCNINEDLIRQTADAMIKTGMKDAGYEYINIDDCWHGERDALGNIQPNAERFPSGIKALADYVHSHGLKLGIYSDAGAKTCGGHPGSRGYEYQDARTYASWGVDYLKYDWCNTKGLNSEGAYTTIRDALQATGRPILLSICEWGDTKPTEWAPAIGQSWRTTADITACWDCERGHGSWSSIGILKILDKQLGLRKFSGPGHWNDMDMLEVGNGISDNEGRAHFSLWAMLNSPLISGNDLRSMSATTIKTLTNKDIIALNQDALGVQALRAIADGDIEVFIKPLADKSWAVLFLNRSNTPVRYDFTWSDHYFDDDISKHLLDLKSQKYDWQEIWSKTKGSTDQALKQTIPAHDVKVYRLTPKV